MTPPLSISDSESWKWINEEPSFLPYMEIAIRYATNKISMDAHTNPVAKK